jgi:hypothetical protein
MPTFSPAITLRRMKPQQPSDDEPAFFEVLQSHDSHAHVYDAISATPQSRR